MLVLHRYNCGCIGFPHDTIQEGDDTQRAVVIDQCDKGHWSSSGLIWMDRECNLPSTPLGPDEQRDYFTLLNKTLDDGNSFTEVQNLLGIKR